MPGPAIPDYVRDAPAVTFSPEPASVMAGDVDRVLMTLAAVSAVVVIAIASCIAFYCWRYRESADVARASGPMPIRRELLVELGWTLPVLAIFLGLFYWGMTLYAEEYGAAGDAALVNVVGKQWMWKLEHHGGVREINELHLAAGERVRVRLTSQDVIHSFYLPAFRVKRDAVPGRYTSFVFTPIRPGIYSLFCSEFCGTDHSRMRGRVVVLSPGDFADWLAAQDVPQTPAQRGKALFTSFGCSGCHAPASDVHAPSLAGLYGRPVPLASGGMAVADAAYLRDSILLPQKDVAAGYEPIMPSYRGQIAEEEIYDLIAYIRSLGAEGAEGS